MAARTLRDLRILKELCKGSQDHRHPRPHQHPTQLLREVSCRRTSLQRSVKMLVFRDLQERLPDSGLQQDGSAGVPRYHLEPAKYDVDECRARGMTFAAPIKVTIRLVTWDTDDAGNQSIRDMKEQEVYFGEIPLMTDHGTFIINGTERVIVSQLHRSPGSSLTTTRARRTRVASCSTARGSSLTAARGWTSSSTRKTSSTFASTVAARCHATVLLRALGFSAGGALSRVLQTETGALPGGRRPHHARARLRSGQGLKAEP